MVGSHNGNRRSRRTLSGFTLLEIVVAMSIFAVTMGATAQGLAYAYGLVNLQNQRVTANNDCRAVLAALRQVALEQPDTTGCPSTANKFPCVLLDFRNTFPASAAAVRNWPSIWSSPVICMSLTLPLQGLTTA